MFPAVGQDLERGKMIQSINQFKYLKIFLLLTNKRNWSWSLDLLSGNPEFYFERDLLENLSQNLSQRKLK